MAQTARPSLLPFDVRHYWVPPYVSPNLFAFLNEVFWPVVLAVPALLSFVAFLLLPRGWKPAQWSAEHRSKAFLFLGFGCFLLFYLLFYKIKTFLLLFSIPWTGYLWVRWRGKYLGRLAWAAVVLCVAVLLGVFAGEKGIAWALGWGAPLLIAVLAAGCCAFDSPPGCTGALVVFARVRKRIRRGLERSCWREAW